MEILFDALTGSGGASEDQAAPRTFRDFVRADIHNVFLNLDELAQPYDIRFNGTLFKDVPASLQGRSSLARQRRGGNSSAVGASDHAQGLARSELVLFCAVSDLDGQQPEQEDRIEIGRGGRFRRFYVGESSLTAGMLRLELEAVSARPGR